MAFLLTSLRTFFFELGSLVSVIWIYVMRAGGPSFRDFFTPWMTAALVDFFINVFALGLWLVYSGFSFVQLAIWTALPICFGCTATCACICILFLKFSTQGSEADPMCNVLLLHGNKSQQEQDKKHSAVIAKRIVFAILGCLVIGAFICFDVNDAHPFSKEVFTPWFLATLISFQVNVFALSVWLACKDASWFCAFMWVVLLMTLSSAAACACIVGRLFQLTSQDLLYLVLLKHNSRNRVSSIQPVSSVMGN